jgi:prepilin-type N-terminal cleavage/methylation domain-containing protein
MQRGFSLIELSAVMLIVVGFIAVALPRQLRARYEAKEAETKHNLHVIQIAVERYAVDTGGEYPVYLLGGDTRGWDPVNGCRAVTEWNNALNNEQQADWFIERMHPPEEPLITYGYLDSYPRNPFLDEGDGVRTIIMNTGASMDPGDGDVRFGWSGEIMGNCLDDPRVLFSDYNEPTRYRNTMYGGPGSFLGVLNANSPNSFYTMGGMPQWTGTRGSSAKEESGTLRYWWPGEFFYRSGGTFYTDESPIVSPGIVYIWGWPYEKIDKYILGAYGSLRTEGLDVIRLTTKEGDAACTQSGAMAGIINGQYYQDHSDPSREASHPDYSFRVMYSNPEVFGGGGPGLMPQFPYYSAGEHRWIYGAPDGFEDGIILMLTDSIDPVIAWEWEEE